LAARLRFCYKNKTVCKIVVQTVKKCDIIYTVKASARTLTASIKKEVKNLQDNNEKEHDGMTSQEFGALARAIMYAANKAQTLDELRAALAEILGEKVPGNKSE